MATPEPEFKVPMIRGSIIGPAKEWIVRTYGKPLYDKALAKLKKDDAAIINGQVVSVGWYPLSAWGAFLEEVRLEVRAATGETEAQFDRRNMFESGQSTLTKVYRLVLGLFDPTTIIAKMMPIYRRVYSHGTIEVAQNDPGYCVLRFQDGPMSMFSEVQRSFPLAIELMLDLAGQESTDMKVVNDRKGESFVLEVRTRYRKKQKT